MPLVVVASFDLVLELSRAEDVVEGNGLERRDEAQPFAFFEGRERGHDLVERRAVDLPDVERAIVRLGGHTTRFNAGYVHASAEPVRTIGTAARDRPRANMFVASGMIFRIERVRMAQATLSVTMPEGVWVQQVSTAHPEATFRVLAAVPGPDTGFALVRIAGPDVASVVEDMHEHTQITELSLAQYSENEATVHFETTAPLLMFSSRDSGMPFELPVEIQDGEATVEVTGSRERLSELAAQLEHFGIQFRVEHVRERLHESQLLSDRQREIVIAAVEQGYYDTPRCCSLTELAGHLGIAKSTCSETLHRAEEAIVKRFVEDLPTAEAEDLFEQPIAE